LCCDVLHRCWNHWKAAMSRLVSSRAIAFLQARHHRAVRTKSSLCRTSSLFICAIFCLRNVSVTSSVDSSDTRFSAMFCLRIIITIINNVIYCPTYNNPDRPGITESIKSITMNAEIIIRRRCMHGLWDPSRDSSSPFTSMNYRGLDPTVSQYACSMPTATQNSPFLPQQWLNYCQYS